METSAKTAMRRTEVRSVLQRHKGSISNLARQLGVSHSAVSLWLSGRSKSARVQAAAIELAQALASQERGYQPSAE